MKFSATIVTLAVCLATVNAHKLPTNYLVARQSLDQLAASQQSKGFVTSPCASDDACQQGCCAFNTGKCAGPAIAQTRDGGCGHGGASPNCNVAKALGLSDCAPNAVNGDLTAPNIQAAAAFTAKLDGIAFTPAAGAAPAPAPAAPAPAAPAPAPAAPPPAAAGPPQSLDQLAASQQSKGFVTSPCANDDACQQGCCAFNTGKCAGPAIAQTRDGGCGHGSASPNCNVAKALGLSDCAPNAVNGDLKAANIQAAAAFTAKLDNIAFTPA